MNLTTHNTEQAARGFVTYELARRGYLVQQTDSRFPNEDLLVVSPTGRHHFGIDVKGQRTKNFWQIKRPDPSFEQLFYFLVYIPMDGYPDIYILDNATTLVLWDEYKNRILSNGGREDGRWGLLWTTPFPFKDNWQSLPK